MSGQPRISSCGLSPNNDLFFNQIYRQYFKRLCLYAFQFVRDEAQAEDIVQSSLIKLWEKRQNVDWTYDAGSLLYQVVKNAAYDFLRSRKNVDDLSGLECGDEENMRRIIMSETMQEIYTASEGLPQKCREIFRLLFLEGKENAEVAKELKITESTIRSQKAKAISYIRGVVCPEIKGIEVIKIIMIGMGQFLQHLF